MKLYKLFFILIVFFKTETLFSENDLFSVNNIQIPKKEKTTNTNLADQAAKKGFDQLISKILLNEDKDKLSDLNLSSIKQLVSYYQILNNEDKKNNEDTVNFNVTFDKEKIHDLFYKRGISYSEISDKELYILPILITNEGIFIFNNNFFYANWNEVVEEDLIEFILPLENIEIIKSINENKESLINLKLINLFKEYVNKDLALIIIEDFKRKKISVYIKTFIQEKNISKNLKLNIENSVKDIQYKKVIEQVNKELVNLVKLSNLIDIRAPSFLITKLKLTKKSNLVELKTRIKNIDLIENIYVQKFNKDYMNLRIKYLGKLEKLIIELKKKNISLKLKNEQWVIKIL